MKGKRQEILFELVENYKKKKKFSINSNNKK